MECLCYHPRVIQQCFFRILNFSTKETPLPPSRSLQYPSMKRTSRYLWSIMFLLLGLTSSGWAEMLCHDMPCCRAERLDDGRESSAPALDAELLTEWMTPGATTANVESSLDLGCYLVCNKPPGVDSGDLVWVYSMMPLSPTSDPVAIPEAAPLSLLFDHAPVYRRPHWKRPDPPPQMSPNPPPTAIS